MKESQTNKLTLEKISISKLELNSLSKIRGGAGGTQSEVGGVDTEPPAQ